MNDTGSVPTVTVVIPYWNLDTAYLQAAVASTEHQGASYRTIVVDNLSDTPLPTLPDHVEVHRLDRRMNVGEARNAGLALVTTSHVLFLDADDELERDAIPRLLQQLASRPDAVVSMGRLSHIAAVDGSTRSPYRPGLSVRELQRRPLLLACVNTVRMLVSMGCVLLRTDVARAAGGFSADPVEQDWVLSSVVAFHGRVVVGDFVARRYRLRGDSLTVMKQSDWRLSRDARRELRRRLRNDPAVPMSIRIAAPLLVVPHEVMPRLRRLRACIRGPELGG